MPLLTLKSFSLWQGKQKSKKTTALALIVAAVICGRINSLDGIKFEGSLEGSVLFFDNEQGESYAARTMKLILKLAGLETSPKSIYCDLREFSPNERKKIIEAGIMATPDVKLVVIDGLVDLLTDFMDAGEGHITITEILKLCSAYNIHVAGVLHQNKADKNARAHVGTISSQKCEIEITTEVDPDDKSRSIVSCINSRGLPFEPFAIRWDKGSLPCICQDWTTITNSDSKANKNYKLSKEIVAMVFKPFTALSNKEAVEGIMNAAKKSESTAKRMLKDYLGWSLVIKSQDGNYRINDDKGSRVQEGSNGVHEPVH
ncbi:MAG: AAA family ATPase [Chitinophagaceae bacterium]